MSRVRADDIPISTDEPFGMNGVSAWLKPLLAMLCLVAACVCVVVSIRSYDHCYGVRRESPNSVMWFETIMGRLQFQMINVQTSATKSDYIPYDWSANRMPDTWAGGSTKILGIDWGEDVRPRNRLRQVSTPVWQFRVRWRTIAIVLAIPSALMLIGARRRRWRRANEAELA